jgi:hypothetical protein
MNLVQHVFNREIYFQSPHSNCHLFKFAGVWSENWRAHGFYMKKMGYVKCGEYDYKVGQCVDREWILREPDSAWKPEVSESSSSSSSTA